MKKRYLVALSAIVVIGLSIDMRHNQLMSSSNTAPFGNTGSPADGNTCARSGCHLGGPAQSNQSVAITSDIPQNGYTPGQTYNMVATMNNGGVRFGFSISPQNTQGAKLGTLIASGAGTALNGPQGKYITHTSSGNSGAGSKTWNFQWTAPNAGTGNVTFYGAFNFANNDGGTSGDVIVPHTQVFSEAIPTGISEVMTNCLTVFPNPATEVIHVRVGNSESDMNVRLYGLDGRLAVNEKYAKGEASIDLIARNIAKGIYVVQVEYADRIDNRKVVIR